MTDVTEQAIETEEPARYNPLLRALLTAFYVVTYNLVEFLLIGFAVIQLLVTLIAGRPWKLLADFGASLALWARDMIRFATAASDRPAFPFGRWPRASAEADPDR